MKRSILGLALAGFLFTAVSAGAASVEERVADLKKAINDEIASKPDVANGNGQRGGYDPRMVAAAIEQITSQLDNPNMGGNADSQINQMLAVFTSDTVQKARQDLLEAIHLQQKEKAEAAANRMKDFLKRVSEEINRAKKPEDLDGLLVELQKFQGDRYSGYGTENQALNQQISGAFEFTKQWQNYLSHVATGQGQLATNDLQNLSQNNYGVGIIPRSHILELLAPNKNGEAKSEPTAVKPPSPEGAIIKSIKTLDDLEPAYNKIELLRQQNSQGYYNDSSSLRTLVQTYQAVKAGLPITANVNLGNDVEISPDVKRQLLLYVLQHYFASYKGKAPGAEEKPADYVARVTTEAAKTHDWTLLKQALSAADYLDSASAIRGYSTRTSTSAVDLLLAGMNQEEAGQYALAVVSYEGALKSLSPDIVPPKMIGDRLDGMQKDHPKEYEQGMQMVIAPPVGRQYFPGIPSYPGMQSYPGMPGYPPTMRPGLSIPGSTNNAPAAPAPPATSVQPQEPAPATNSPPTAPVPPSTNSVPKPTPQPATAPSTE